MSKTYQYEGFILELSSFHYLTCWGLYFTTILFTPTNFHRVTDYFVVSAVTAVVAPLATVIGLGGYPVLPLVATIASLFIVVLVSNGFGSLRISFPFIKGGERIAVSVSIALVFLIVMWLVATGAAFNLNLNFSRVYEFRSENAELSAYGLFAYLNNWVYQVINVFLIAYFLHRRKAALFFLACILQVFFFAVSAHKSVFFYPFLVVSIWYYFRKTRSLIIVPILFGTIIFGSFLYFLVFEDIILPSMFIRRVFFIPAILTVEYFEFFSQNAFVYWSNSVLSPFIDYPYAERMTVLIGEFRGTNASANNGYVSSGFAHAGLLGVLVYSIMVGAILGVIDALSRNSTELWFYLALVIVPLRSALISSDLFTSLLTHGLLLSILLIFLVRKRYHLKL